MRRPLALCTLFGAAALLAACGEKPQTLQSGVKVDGQAFQGTATQFAAPAWKQGDKVSWEQHLKTRTQQGQNEYNKVN